MGYETRTFRVFETGWPYLNSDDAVRHQRGTAAAIRMTIGKCAVWTASVGSLLKLPLGNRFVAIASPRA